MTHIVIKNLKETNESTDVQVNDILKYGLRLKMKVESLERKQTRRDGEIGVVVAKCKTKEDKNEIMKSKSNLRNTRTYKNVYIEHDRPKSERNTISNLKTIAGVIGNEKVMIRGNRLLPRRYSDNSDHGRYSNNRYNIYDRKAEFRGNNTHHQQRYQNQYRDNGYERSRDRSRDDERSRPDRYDRYERYDKYHDRIEYSNGYSNY
jgi:hypothetical protein